MSDSPIVVARVATERGELVLRQDGNDYEVISNGTFLMDTRGGHSEQLLVDAALQRHPAPHDVLIGGLGIGFSLVAALRDHRVAQVTVVEVEQALVEWHDTHLASFSGGLLHDARVVVVVADISTHLAARASSYDVVCLDVDNGPDWTVIEANKALYDDAGSKASYLVDYAEDIDPSWLEGVTTVGVTSGASVPEILVRGVLDWLAERGYSDVKEVVAAEESLLFALPQELRRDMKAKAATAR